MHRQSFKIFSLIIPPRTPRIINATAFKSGGVAYHTFIAVAEMKNLKIKSPDPIPVSRGHPYPPEPILNFTTVIALLT